MAIAIGSETPAPAEPLPAPLAVAFDRALGRAFVAFQPIVSFRDRTVFGWEALVRTRDPGYSSANEIVQAAESLGQLRALGRIVRAAAGEAAARAPGGVSLFVNLHAKDLLDPELFAGSSPLSRVAPRVVLELTERAATSGVPDFGGRLAALRRMGFRIAVDDLGAGYSSLGLLANVRPDLVKLDRELVHDLDRHAPRRRIVRHLLALLEDLGTIAVAEGVETAEERDALLALGSPLLQGFLFGVPAEGLGAPRW